MQIILYWLVHLLYATVNTSLKEIIKYMNKKGYRFLWTDREERIHLVFKKQIILEDVKMNTFLVRDCKII